MMIHKPKLHKGQGHIKFKLNLRLNGHLTVPQSTSMLNKFIEDSQVRSTFLVVFLLTKNEPP